MYINMVICRAVIQKQTGTKTNKQKNIKLDWTDPTQPWSCCDKSAFTKTAGVKCASNLMQAAAAV